MDFKTKLMYYKYKANLWLLNHPKVGDALILTMFTVVAVTVAVVVN